MIGKKESAARILRVIPQPSQGYGHLQATPSSASPQHHAGARIDVLKAYEDTAGETGPRCPTRRHPATGQRKSGSAPTLGLPVLRTPPALVTKTLVKGKGAKVAKGAMSSRSTTASSADQKVFGSSVLGLAVSAYIGASPRQRSSGLGQGLVGQTWAAG